MSGYLNTRNVKSLTVQALGQRDGYRMTLLCVELDDAAELEDEMRER